MRTLVCLVTLGCVWLGWTSPGWSQREVPPPVDVPTALQPASSETTAAQPSAPTTKPAVAAPAKKPGAQPPTASPAVAGRQPEKRAAKNAVASKTAPTGKAKPDKRLAKNPTPPKKAVSPKKASGPQLAKKKPEDSPPHGQKASS